MPSDQVKKTGKSNLTSMVSNLKACLPNMYQLFLALKSHPGDHSITQEEFELASGKKTLDAEKVKEYFDKLEPQENICTAFDKQTASTAGPWDQDKFEELLAEWIVACNQPFEEIDRPEFRDMLTYVHHPAPELKIHHCNAIR